MYCEEKYQLKHYLRQIPLISAPYRWHLPQGSVPKLGASGEPGCTTFHLWKTKQHRLAVPPSHCSFPSEMECGVSVGRSVSIKTRGTDWLAVYPPRTLLSSCLSRVHIAAGLSLRDREGNRAHPVISCVSVTSLIQIQTSTPYSNSLRPVTIASTD